MSGFDLAGALLAVAVAAYLLLTLLRAEEL